MKNVWTLKGRSKNLHRPHAARWPRVADAWPIRIVHEWKRVLRINRRINSTSLYNGRIKLTCRIFLSASSDTTNPNTPFCERNIRDPAYRAHDCNTTIIRARSRNDRYLTAAAESAVIITVCRRVFTPTAAVNFDSFRLAESV